MKAIQFPIREGGDAYSRRKGGGYKMGRIESKGKGINKFLRGAAEGRRR